MSGAKVTDASEMHSPRPVIEVRYMVSLTIDGKTISVPKGTTILEAARRLDIAIPTLCWLQKVSPTGACRICAVEVAGVDRTMTACNTPVKEGIVVTTQSEKLTAIRKQIVELLLVNHPLDCPVCDAGGECELQDTCYAFGVDRQPFEAENVNPGPIDGWPLIQQVPSRCVLCEKCVKVCHEVVGSSSLFLNDKGDKAFIDKKLELCEFCGNCVSVCPTGTMISKPFKYKARPWELTKTRSVCTYCPSHCEVDLNVKNGQVFRVTSEDGTTVNDGTLCIGGSFGYGYLNSPQRLATPLLKGSAASWDVALGEVVSRLSQLRATAGGAAVAALGSARLTNEENYLLQKLFRAAVGSNNIDSEARFGVQAAAQSLYQSLGLRGGSNHINTIGQSAAVLVFGADVTAEAPAVDWQILKAARKRDGKLIVANMRKVKLNRFANVSLQYCPGSEIALANALARILLEKGLADQDHLKLHVANLDELKAHLMKVDLERAASDAGVSLKDLEEAAQNLGAAPTVSIIFGADITRGEDSAKKVSALANLALVAGALRGKVGGVFPIDEKGNMQGLLDMGVCPEMLPGYQGYKGAKARFEAAWKVRLPEGGRDALGILDGIEKGEIKALYLAGVNPLVSFPESDRWRNALEKVEFLVVQDILESELTRMAQVVLPGAAFAEKSGSLTSFDNRISCLTKAVGAPGLARQDADILLEVFNRLAIAGAGQGIEEIRSEIRQLVPLYSDACFTGSACRPCLKAPYVPAEGGLKYVAVDSASAAAGLQLLSGKHPFHFGTTSTFADGMVTVAAAGFIALSPADAAELGVKDGATIKVASVVGAAQGPASICESLPKGLLFAPYHFADVNIQKIMPSTGNRVSVTLGKV